MRFLSLQSHVAYGYVGNRAATFPLQRLGHEVWAVNTVEFSNHTGYGAWRGRTAPADQVADIVAGIEALGLLSRCDALLTGYVGDAALGDVVLDTARKVRAANAKAVWCCDPVLGDVDTGIYVKPGIDSFFRERAIPLADLITPNHFELEHLTGNRVATMRDALAAARSLLKGQPGLLCKTWLSGLHNNTAGGIYGFDTIDNAEAFALDYFPIQAKALNAAYTTRIFDAAPTIEAMREAARQRAAAMARSMTFAVSPSRSVPESAKGPPSAGPSQS